LTYRKQSKVIPNWIIIFSLKKKNNIKVHPISLQGVIWRQNMLHADPFVVP